MIEHYPRTARLVNRFKLGADPEFVMSDAWGHYVFAENLGMTTLTAFGCDMAGRQAEIRAYPSRFALEVIASIMDSLRWMAYVYPQSLDANWNAVAFNGRDGCGGHVHFGRRRPNRDLDINTLDQVARLLGKYDVFDRKGIADRREHTHYGDLGDVRPQKHGYEYRTFPTQLSSPWLAYFTLVLSKLSVFVGTPPEDKEGVLKLFKAFECRDDDAAIALRAVELFGFPKQFNTDFKKNWGISLTTTPTKWDRFFFPSMIKPSQRTCESLFNLFTRGIAPLAELPTCNWEPYLLPDKVYKVRVQQHTMGHAPDIAMNLVSKHIPVQIRVGGNFDIGTPIVLPTQKIAKALNQEKIRCTTDRNFDAIYLTIPKEANQSIAACNLIKTILADMNLFPVRRASKLSEGWGPWETVEYAGAKEKPKLGKIVAHITAPQEVVAPRVKKPTYRVEEDF